MEVTRHTVIQIRQKEGGRYLITDEGRWFLYSDTGIPDDTQPTPLHGLKKDLDHTEFTKDAEALNNECGFLWLAVHPKNLRAGMSVGHPDLKYGRKIRQGHINSLTLKEWSVYHWVGEGPLPYEFTLDPEEATRLWSELYNQHYGPVQKKEPISQEKKHYYLSEQVPMDLLPPPYSPDYEGTLNGKVEEVTQKKLREIRYTWREWPCCCGDPVEIRSSGEHLVDNSGVARIELYCKFDSKHNKK